MIMMANYGRDLALRSNVVALLVTLLVLSPGPLCCVLCFPLHAAALEVQDWDRDLQSVTTGGSGNVTQINEEEVTYILKDEAVQRLHDLGQVSDSEEFLQRTFLSPASIRAGQLIRSWMTEAGLFTWVDNIGNIHGRFDGVKNSAAPALLLGSHLDTVVDAGRYDGALGIITAIAAVKAMHLTGRLAEFPRPVEIIAFSDEEGIRFQSTFLGSAGVAGTLLPRVLDSRDKSGVTVRKALEEASLEWTSSSLSAVKYDPESVWGYVEVHIEQGPVLENKGLPLGVVDAISGQNRLRVSMKGAAGHAGTVPMNMRRDPMPAAALSIVTIDELCRHPEDFLDRRNFSKKSLHETPLVCTVGEISTYPGASNVIPGEVVFSVDLRTKSDQLREATVSAIESSIGDICQKRGLSCNVEHKNVAQTRECDPVLTEKLREAASAATDEVLWTRGHRHNLKKLQETTRSIPMISSGAGHDALAMAQLTKIGMIFVRCEGGASHSPIEFVLEDDTWAASRALYAFLESEVVPHGPSTVGAAHLHHHTSKR